MNHDEMFDRVLIECGQFRINKNSVELNIDAFVTLIRSSLGTYNRQRPATKRYNLYSPTRRYIFTENTTSEEGIQIGIPEEIVDAIPLTFAGVPYYYFTDRHTWELDKKTYPFVYDNPSIWLPMVGNYDIKSMHDHVVREEVIEGEKIYHVDTIGHKEDVFFKLLAGKFLMGLARSRRAFILNDVPITTDADTLYSEGQAMEEKAEEDLSEKVGKWYLAWGG